MALKPSVMRHASTSGIILNLFLSQLFPHIFCHFSQPLTISLCSSLSSSFAVIPLFSKNSFNIESSLVLPLAFAPNAFNSTLIPHSFFILITRLEARLLPSDLFDYRLPHDKHSQTTNEKSALQISETQEHCCQFFLSCVPDTSKAFSSKHLHECHILARQDNLPVLPYQC